MSSTTLKPTNHLTFNNLYFALPNLILCIEMALIAPLFVYAYPAKPYYRKNQPNGFANYHASSSYGLKALWSVINISDLVRGLVFAVQFYISTYKDRHSAAKYIPGPGPGGMDHEQTSYSASDRWRYQNTLSSSPSSRRYSEAPYQPGRDRAMPLAHTRGNSRSEMYPLRG